MTTSQGERPLSRKALRESERAAAEAVAAPAAPTQSANYASDQGFSQEGPAHPQPEFRVRSRHSAPEAGQPMRRPRASDNRQESGEVPRFRVRDYSPEARGEAFSTTAEVPPVSPCTGSAGSGLRPRVRAESTIPEQVEPAVVDPPKVVTGTESPKSTQPPTEQTLSRRELRAIREAALGNTQVASGPSVAPSASEASYVPSAEAASPDSYSAPQSVPDLIQPPIDWQAQRVQPEPVQQVQPEAMRQPASEERIAAPEAPRFTEFSAQWSSAPMSGTPGSGTPDRVVQGSSTPDPNVPVREVVTAPEVYETAPTHWSRQPEIDDQFASLIGHHSRDIAASGAITTSALVMPNFPSTSTITAPLGETGEILLTGTVNLPRSLATSGYNRSRFDSSDLDNAADPRDREIASMDSAPVRASDAVSTHTSTQSVLIARRPKGSKLIMGLSITGAAMGIGVILLFAAGMIFKIF